MNDFVRINRNSVNIGGIRLDTRGDRRNPQRDNGYDNGRLSQQDIRALQTNGPMPFLGNEGRRQTQNAQDTLEPSEMQQVLRLAQQMGLRDQIRITPGSEPGTFVFSYDENGRISNPIRTGNLRVSPEALEIARQSNGIEWRVPNYTPPTPQVAPTAPQPAPASLGQTRGAAPAASAAIANEENLRASRDLQREAPVRAAAPAPAAAATDLSAPGAAEALNDRSRIYNAEAARPAPAAAPVAAAVAAAPAAPEATRRNFNDLLIEGQQAGTLTPSALNMLMAQAREQNINLDISRAGDGVYRFRQEGERGLGTALRFDAESSATLDRGIATAEANRARLAAAPAAPRLEVDPAVLAGDTRLSLNGQPVAADPAAPAPAATVPAAAAPAPAPAASAAPAAPVQFVQGDNTVVNNVMNGISEASRNRAANDDARAIEQFLRETRPAGQAADTRPGFADDGILSEQEATAALNRAQALRWSPDGTGAARLSALDAMLNGSPQATTAAAPAASATAAAPAPEVVAAASETAPTGLDQARAQAGAVGAGLRDQGVSGNAQPTIMAELAPGVVPNVNVGQGQDAGALRG